MLQTHVLLLKCTVTCSSPHFAAIIIPM